MLTAQSIANLAVELLKRRLVLPQTVLRVPSNAMLGPNGGTTTIRVRVPRTANEQSSPGTDVSSNFDPIEEVAVPITFGHFYDGTILSDEDLNLNLEDFGSQVLEPLVSSVATAAEDTLADEINDIDPDGEIEFAAEPDGDADKATILAARTALTRADVPLGNRFAAVSPEIAERVLAIPEVVPVDSSGRTGAFQDATIGRYLGFTFVESAALTEDEATFYHRSGFAFANQAPAPASGADSATATSDGITLRAVRDFMAGNLSEVAVVQTFAGAARIVEDEDSDPTEARYIKVGVGSS